MDHLKNYTVCLPDWDSVLPKLCEILEATYHKGDFDSFEDVFLSSGEDESYWKVEGKTGCDILIELEKYEGYFFRYS
jgi:hypothetical protein